MILSSFVLILSASTRSSSSVLMNLMMSDENNRDIYITIASMPPPKPCSHCCPVPSATTIRTGRKKKIHYMIWLPSTYKPSISTQLMSFFSQETGIVWSTATCSTAGTRWCIHSLLSSQLSSSKRTKWSCWTPATLWWPVGSRSAQVTQPHSWKNIHIPPLHDLKWPKITSPFIVFCFQIQCKHTIVHSVLPR